MICNPKDKIHTFLYKKKITFYKQFKRATKTGKLLFYCIKFLMEGSLSMAGQDFMVI